MKRNRFSLAQVFAVLAVLFLLCLSLAQAGEVYDRTSVITLNSSGTATWTQDLAYANIEITRVGLIAMNYATDTVTVSRVTGDSRPQTNAIFAIVCASNAGASNYVASAGAGPNGMKFGDKLTFTSGMGSNGYAFVEYKNQRH